MLLIDLREGKMSGGFHVLLTRLSFGRDSFASLRPASEIHHPITDEKVNFIVEDSAVPGASP